MSNLCTLKEGPGLSCLGVGMDGVRCGDCVGGFEPWGALQFHFGLSGELALRPEELRVRLLRGIFVFP